MNVRFNIKKPSEIGDMFLLGQVKGKTILFKYIKKTCIWIIV